MQSKEKIKEQLKQWYLENKEKTKEYGKQYYLKNKAQDLLKNKQNNGVQRIKKMVNNTVEKIPSKITMNKHAKQWY
jgi:predicted NACHT family NTPase